METHELEEAIDMVRQRWPGAGRTREEREDLRRALGGFDLEVVRTAARELRLERGRGRRAPNLGRLLDKCRAGQRRREKRGASALETPESWAGSWRRRLGLGPEVETIRVATALHERLEAQRRGTTGVRTAPWWCVRDCIADLERFGVDIHDALRVGARIFDGWSERSIRLCGRATLRRGALAGAHRGFDDPETTEPQHQPFNGPEGPRSL